MTGVNLQQFPGGDGFIQFRSGRFLNINGVISNSGNITFTQWNFSSSSGQCELNNTNTFTGNVTILRGTVKSNVANSISTPNSITVTTPGQLQINNVSQTIKSLGTTNTGNIVLNQGALNTLTITQTSLGTLSGVISGSGNFEKAGSSTLKIGRASCRERV